jgi:hypothetical protein
MQSFNYGEPDMPWLQSEPVYQSLSALHFEAEQAMQQLFDQHTAEIDQLGRTLEAIGRNQAVR